MSTKKLSIRSNLLLGAGSVVVASLMSGGAFGAENNITAIATPVPALGGTTIALATINSNQENAANTEAIVTGNAVASSSSSGASQVSATVVDNTIHASAAGNSFDNPLNLAVLPAEDDQGTGDGASALGLSINLANITGDASTNAITNTVVDLDLGTIAVKDSVIAAAATANTGSTELSGALSSAYASPSAGQASLALAAAPSADILTATGSLVASTAQFNMSMSPVVPVAISARAEENDVALTATNTAGIDEATASFQVQNNYVSAAAGGNNSNSTISVESGAATFNGTAVLTNSQLNANLGAGLSITGSAYLSDISAFLVPEAGEPAAALKGSVLVTNNSISASAVGNSALGTSGEAGNRLLLADGASFEGNAATIAPATSISYNNSAMAAVTDADLIIQNSQANMGASAANPVNIAATAIDAAIGADVKAVEGGKVTVANNAVLTSALGNAASSALATGSGSPSFEGSAASANQQINYDVNITAETESWVSAYVGSDIALAGAITTANNQSGASATGSASRQSVTVDAVTQTLPLANVALTASTAGAVSHANLAADGSVTVANIQANYGTDIAANASGASDAEFADDSISDSKVTVDSNSFKAEALGLDALNALTLSGTTVGSGAGIVSLQVNDSSSGDLPTISAEVAGGSKIDALFNANNSKLELTNNVQQARAYGAYAGNSLTVDAESTTALEVAADDALAAIVNYNPAGSNGRVLTADGDIAVNAAYGTLNVQSLNGHVSAQSGGTSGSSFSVGMEDDLENSSLTNSENASKAAAVGAFAANEVALNVGTLGDGTYASVANLTNVQEATVNSTVTARIPGGTAVYTLINEDVSNSNVSTSANTLEALAYANDAINSLVVDGTTISTYDASDRQGLELGLESFVDGAFSVLNAQGAGGAITATLRNSAEDSSASIVTDIAGAVERAKIASDDNSLTASAAGNRASNQLGLSANSIDSTSSLGNIQVIEVGTAISSWIGTLPPDEDSPGIFSDISIAYDGDVEGSNLSIAQNTIEGSVTGNSAANRLTLGGGSSVNNDPTNGVSLASGDTPVDATANHALGNLQIVRDESKLNSVVRTALTIDFDESAEIENSRLSITGNQQSSTSTGNTAASILELVAANTTSTIVLASSQNTGPDTEISANSDVIISTPVVSSGSSIRVSENTNDAFALANDAKNTLTVDAANVTNVATQVHLSYVVDLGGPSPLVPISAGSHVLQNFQHAEGSVSSSATTEILNQETDPSGGIVNGSVTIANNTTRADAIANRAVNFAEIAAGATLEAALGLNNLQANEGNVTATAWSKASVDVTGFDDPETEALNGSGVAVARNSTAAVAAGNVASNALNYDAGASYPVPDPVQPAITELWIAPTILTQGQTFAQAAVLNAQANTGAISATASQTFGNAVLNGVNGSAAIADSSVRVAGNAAAAGAYGNTAYNTVTIAALNSGTATAAVASVQTNSGPVTATVTNVSYGINAVGSVSNSSLAVSGNHISATAVGNSAVNTIAAR